MIALGWGISRTPPPRRDVREAVAYGGAIIGAALLVMIIAAVFSAGSSTDCPSGSGYDCLTASQYVLVIAPPALLALGALGALGRTLVVWRRNGPWMIWHGAMWFLLVVMIVYVGIAGTSLMR